jgi:hypothetical protein
LLNFSDLLGTGAFNVLLPLLVFASLFRLNIPVIFLGNEVIFTLETASDYVKDDRAPSYGFKCLVTGYEWYYNPGEGLHRLESELSFLGAMCAASLLKKDLILPPTGGKDFFFLGLI